MIPTHSQYSPRKCVVHGRCQPGSQKPLTRTPTSFSQELLTRTSPKNTNLLWIYLCTTALLSCLPHNHILLRSYLTRHMELRALHRIRTRLRCQVHAPYPALPRTPNEGPSQLRPELSEMARAGCPAWLWPSESWRWSFKSPDCLQKTSEVDFLLILLLLIWSNNNLYFELEFLFTSCERPQMMVCEHKYVKVVCTFLLYFISI